MDMLPQIDTDTSVRRPRGQSRGWLRGAVALVAVGGLAYLGFNFMSHAPQAPFAMPPADVTIAQPLSRRVLEWDDYIGRFAASQTVDVRPRVSGQIMELHFKDGDMVQKGQILFTIDQRPFLAAAAEARADVANASSTLALAQSDLRRATRLKGDDAVSQGEIDAIRARWRETAAADWRGQG